MLLLLLVLYLEIIFSDCEMRWRLDMFEEMDKDNEWVALIVMSAGLDSFDMENC